MSYIRIRPDFALYSVYRLHIFVHRVYMNYTWSPDEELHPNSAQNNFSYNRSFSCRRSSTNLTNWKDLMIAILKFNLWIFIHFFILLFLMDNQLCLSNAKVNAVIVQHYYFSKVIYLFPCPLYKGWRMSNQFYFIIFWENKWTILTSELMSNEMTSYFS